VAGALLCVAAIAATIPAASALRIAPMQVLRQE
jgi:ABC-type lipoprotein release transport system permease subunit